jgi:eukaryotic-like serine/threonine-protein kinase
MTAQICPQCNSANRDISRFCSECGAALPGSKPLAPEPAPESGPAPGATVITGSMLIERYRIISELGRGGFGAVYRAWDTRLNRAVAVKENLLDAAESQRQFSREAQVLADLSHPNLPRVIDYFTIPGRCQYLVMDFVEGEDLQSMLGHAQRVELEQALAWIAQVAEALEYLHGHEPPLLHRDIKPANIRITPKGKAMLVDFGLVKAYHPTMKTTLGARAVSPGYAPPEQYGLGATDERSDIYALAATLYALLTLNQPPESVQRLAGRPLLPIQQANPQAPAYLVQAVERGLALDPAQRFQSASEFKAALRPPAAQVVQVQRQSGAAELYPATQVTPSAVSREFQPAAGMPGSTQVVPPAPAAPVSKPAAPPRRPSAPPAAAPQKAGRRSLLAGGLVLALVGLLCLAALGGGGYILLNGISAPGSTPAKAGETLAAPAARPQATANGQATPALSLTGAISVTQWMVNNFKTVYYDCYQASLCWKYDPESAQPGELISSRAIALDPAWKHPGLVFMQEFDLGTKANPGTVFVLVEDADHPASAGAGMPVEAMISSGASLDWQEKRVDLSKYAGKRIIIHFQVSGKPPDYWAVSDILIVPDLAP